MESKRIRTIIVDDNEDWRELISIRVEAHPKLRLIGAFDSPTAAFDLITEGGVDLMLLDIEMPEINGLDFMKQLTKPPLVIFITSHRDFAVESYETQAVDYLTKPLTTIRFMQAVEKVVLRWTEKILPPSGDDKFFFIREHNAYVKVEIDSILFLKSLENYTQIVTPDYTYMTLMSLTAIEDYLPPSVFQRVQRSYIVNISKITAVNKTELFIGSYEIPMTRTFAEGILNGLVKSRLVVKGSLPFE